MIRLRSQALALVAVASIVMVGGCSGSSGTPTPPPITDPHEVITKALAGAPNIQSLHIKVEVSGKVNAGALGSSGGGLGLSGNLDLAGTSLEGDLDVVKQATDLKFAVPAMLGLTGEIIVVGGSAYTKISLTGDKFSQSKLSDTIPISIPSPGAIASGAFTDQIAQLRKTLTDAGVVATLKPDGKVDGKDAYDVSYTIPIDKINSMLAAQGGSAAAGITIDSASVEIWVYKDNLLPAKLEAKAGAATLGNLDVTVTLTNYNQPVTINAPAASDIATPAPN